MDEAGKNLDNPPDSSDVVDGVMVSCLKKNQEDKDIEEFQKKFREEVVISKTGKFDEFYSMNYEHKGLLIIFAHSNFIFGNLRQRNADVDQIMLTKTFRNIGFEVRLYRDCTMGDIGDIMSEVSSINFEDYASIAVAISSHGKYHMISALDTFYDPEKIIYNPIKNIKTLLGKPKMFFISACRGDKVDKGATLLNQVQTDSGYLEEYTIPMEADCLFAYATVFDYISFSNEVDGSHFFKYITEAIKEYPDEDLLSVLTIANRKLVVNFTSHSSNPLYSNNKQCMSFLSTLTRKIKFKQ